MTFLLGLLAYAAGFGFTEPTPEFGEQSMPGVICTVTLDPVGEVVDACFPAKR